MLLRRFLLISLMALSLSGLVVAAADEHLPPDREFQLKTAYLFHFAELAEWPDAGDISICLRGPSPLGSYLPLLEGRQIAHRIVHVKVLVQDAVDDCNILFLGDDEIISSTLAAQARDRHILLVGDGEDFVRNGGMLQFTRRDNKLKLLVNLPAVKAAGLKLSSKLLRMAEILE